MKLTKKIVIIVFQIISFQETSPGLNLEKFARLSKKLRMFSLSEWQFIGPATKQRKDIRVGLRKEEMLSWELLLACEV